MVKTDQGTEDEEKMIEDEHSTELQQQQHLQQQQQQQLLQQQQQAKQDATGAKQAKTSKPASTTAEETKSKGGKQRKGAETKIQEQPVEQFVEPINPIDEILLNRPPTPPKPKTILPQVDAKPFIRYVVLILIFWYMSNF
jgi:hypothetical protein